MITEIEVDVDWSDSANAPTIRLVFNTDELENGMDKYQFPYGFTTSVELARSVADKLRKELNKCLDG